MEFVSRTFRSDERLTLPADSVILDVPPPQSSGAHDSSGSCGKGSSCSCGSGTAESTDESVAAQSLLVVSPKAASYFVISTEHRPALDALISRRTIGEAIRAASPNAATGRRLVSEILQRIEFRNFYDAAPSHEHVPDGSMLQIYVTNRCNLRCKHCYMSSGLPLQHGEVETADRLRALDYFAELHPGGQVTFTGGEALLDPDIFTLLEHAKGLGLRTELYSNGLTLTEQSIARIVETVDELQISLDGATAQHHELIRGKRTFGPTLAAIQAVDRAAASGTGFRYRITFTLTPSNAEDIKANLGSLLCRLDLKNVARILIGAASAVGRASQNQLMYSSVEDMRRLESGVMHHLALAGVLRLPVFSVNRFSKTCGQGATITLGADGAIFPCSITEQRPIGNICDGDAKAVMAKVKGYVRSSSVDNVEGCNRCPIRYFCGGICRITNFKRMGSFTKSACTPEYKGAQIRSLVRKYESFELSAGHYAALNS